MKKNFARFIQIFIILVFLLGSVNLQTVFAQDETPVVTDTPQEVVTEQIVVTEVPATVVVPTEAATEILTEEVTEVPTEVATETPVETEELSEVVEILNAQEMQLTDANGDALSLGSQEAAEVLASSDPFFYNETPQTIGGIDLPVGWVGYTLDGLGCPIGVICLEALKPFQATVNAALNNLNDTTIYVASGVYLEDVTIDAMKAPSKVLSFAGFNSVLVSGTSATVTNPGFATVNRFNLNSNFGITNGVFGNSILVNSGGYLSDALALVNPLINEATIEADVKIAGVSGNFTIQDAYHTTDPAYEGGCGEPDVTIYTGTKYHMILKTPYNNDVINYYKTDLSESTAQVTARIEDLMLAAGVSEEKNKEWSSEDKQKVYWYLLGQIPKSQLSGNNDNQGQKKLATQIEEMIFNSENLSQKLWFLWPVYRDNPNNLVSPSNTQLTFLKLPIPTTGDDKKITICHAAGRADEPANFVTLTLSVNAVYGNGGHFNNNGTPKAGHEKDYLGPCIDVCNNMDGNQQVIPDGQMSNGTGGCAPIVCTIDGVNHATMPTGYMDADNEAGCAPIVCTIGETDYGTMPEGYMAVETEAGCAPIVCTIGETEYATMPEGMIVVDGVCVTPIITPLVPVTGAAPALLIPVTGGQLIPVTGGTLIVSGIGHSCMTYNNGQVICWGLNASGQVGDGTLLDQHKPVYVKDLEGVLNLTAGSKHTCALMIDGEIWCWGENSSGQLGNNTVVNSNVPVKVEGLPDKVLAITAGEEFTCAQMMNQDVWCWGKNNLGQLNDGTTTNQLKPVKSKLNTMLAQISGGQGLLLGSDFFGSVNEWAKVQAAAVQQLAGSLSISANRWGDTGCAVASDGSVKCWDSNLISAAIKDTLPAMEVGAGMEHSCVVNNDQTVSCWGANLSGQLGNGSYVDSLSATLVKNMSKVRALGVGANHTCVLSGTNNTPMCWGENTYGQLGNDSITNSNLPVYVILPAIQ